MTNTSAIAEHYERSDLGEAIVGALKAAGKDVDHLTTEDLAPVDEFHTRGRIWQLAVATSSQKG